MDKILIFKIPIFLYYLFLGLTSFFVIKQKLNIQPIFLFCWGLNPFPSKQIKQPRKWKEPISFSTDCDAKIEFSMSKK